jgi:hypothetical protein
VLTDRASEDAERRAVAATNARVLDNILAFLLFEGERDMERHRGRETALNGGYFLLFVRSQLAVRSSSRAGIHSDRSLRSSSSRLPRAASKLAKQSCWVWLKWS